MSQGAKRWKGTAGLAEDIRYYGEWMRSEAEKRIGHLYPKVKIPKEQGGGEATVIAWIWARRVKCPQPYLWCEDATGHHLFGYQRGGEIRHGLNRLLIK